MYLLKGTPSTKYLVLVNHGIHESYQFKKQFWEYFSKNAQAKGNKCGNILSIKQGSTKSLIGSLYKQSEEKTENLKTPIIEK